MMMIRKTTTTIVAAACCCLLLLAAACCCLLLLAAVLSRLLFVPREHLTVSVIGSRTGITGTQIAAVNTCVTRNV